MVRYHNITHDDMLNGDGLRTVVWLSGCPHHCKNCHNEETWSPESGIPVDDRANAEIMDSVSKDYIAGVTFSGGDPLAPYNRDYVASVAADVKALGKTVWVYTGYDWDEIKDIPFIVDCTDVVVDRPYIDALRDTSIYWCGSSNQRVIDVKKSIAANNVILWT